MLPSSRNPVPDKTWTLDNWFTAATQNEMAQGRFLTLANDLWGLEDDPIAEAGRRKKDNAAIDPNRGVSGLTKDGIAKREHALALITALGACARKNGIRLMHGPDLRVHSRLFLRRPICTSDFMDLTGDEVARIAQAIATYCGGGVEEPPPDPDSELLERVFPPPPHKLTGRKVDFDRVGFALRESPIVVIDANPGTGKTSLAWHASLYARDSEFVAQIDWNTDKRMMIDIDGKERETHQPPLTYMSVLLSMANRFGWVDVLETPYQNQRRIEELCRQHLRKEMCLIVLDNIETVKGYEEMLHRLADLIRPKRSALQLSHILVTSRVALPFDGCARVDIYGLDQTETDQYITILEKRYQNQRQAPLNTVQRGKLYQVTEGNPLCLQIAIARYFDGASSFDTIIDQLSTGSGFYAMFKNLFEGLCEGLDNFARCMAVNAAFADPITYAKLVEDWVRKFPDADEEIFLHTLKVLVRMNILYPSANGAQTTGAIYTMHPLIRAYLQQRDCDCL